MEHEVHGTYAQHGGVGVEAVEHAALVVLGVLALEQVALVVLLDVLGGLNDEAGRTHGRVAYGVLDGGAHEFHHHAYDVARCAELSVIARSSHLAQDVLVDIAHGVAVVHVQGIDALHYLGEGARTLYEEGGVCHEAAIGAFATLAQSLDEDEHVLADGAVHGLSLHVAEHAPAQGVVGHVAVRFGVVPCALPEGWVLHLHAPGIGIGLLGALGIVQHLHEEEVGHLLQYGDGICYASRPEGIPDGVYAVLYLACYHVYGIIMVYMRKVTK